MSLWRQLRRGVQVLFQRAARDREIADEVAHYLEQSAAAHRARGLSPAAAARAARLELGSDVAVREQVRGYGWENVVDAMFANLRIAARRLRSEPGFTAVTVFTLALGLGAATAIFSAIKPILIEPLPYPAADRIVVIQETGSDGARSAGTFGMYHALSARADAFQDITVFKAWLPTLSGRAQPERLTGQRVSSAYFRVLGVAPALGRTMTADEDRQNGPAVVVLSDALWRRRFAADPRIVGSTVALDGEAHLVLGVMPRTFENVLAPSAELWAPLQYDITQGRAWGHHLRTVGRLRDGVTAEQAALQLNTIGRSVLEEQRPPTYGREVRFHSIALQSDVTRAVRPALLAITAAVLLVLAIACVNVANLLLARAARTRGEFALRAALGAGRRRLIGQQLTESLFLALLGGLFGLGVALLAMRALIALSPAELPRVSAIGLDRNVYLFALACTTVVGLICGLIPALQAARSNPQRALQQDTRRVAGGHRRTRRTLVVAEVALALLLVVSSGLLLRSMQQLFATETGFTAPDLLTAQVQVSGQRFSNDSATHNFFAQALAAVRATPGVSAAALTSQLPLSGDADLYGVTFEPTFALDPGEMRGTFRYGVSPGYFETMGIPLRRGRFLDDGDGADAPRVAVISESLARRRLPGIDPLGQRLRIGSGPLYTVVGVVGDVRQVSLALRDAEAVYVTSTQWRFADPVMSFVVRTRGPAPQLGTAIREAVWAVDREQPVTRVASMSALVAATAAERRFALVLFQAFSVAALLLAAAGIYGLLAGSVTERTREIGVRSALGATRSRIVALVLREGLSLTGAGLAIGLAAAALASRSIRTMLFGISPLDVITYAVGIGVLALVSLLACAGPPGAPRVWTRLPHCASEALVQLQGRCSPRRRRARARRTRGRSSPARAAH